MKISFQLSLVTSKTNWATLIVLHGIKTPCVRSKMMTPSFEVLSMLFLMVLLTTRRSIFGYDKKQVLF